MKQQQEPEGFEAFWTLWRPHQRGTDGRGKARPTYLKLMLQGALPDDIIDGAKWYLRNLKERDREFIPLASSWLNSERWKDDCLLERAYVAREAERAQRASQAPNITQLRPSNYKTPFLRAYEQQQAREA